MNICTGSIVPIEIPDGQRSDAGTVEPRTEFACVLLRSVVAIDQRQANGALVDSVLHLPGVDLVDQVPLLDSYDRSSVGNVLGSVRGLGIDLAGNEIRGSACFAIDVPRAEAARRLVQQGHLQTIGVVLWPVEITVVRAGESFEIDGTTYTARDVRHLEVVSKSALKAAALGPLAGDGVIESAGTEDGMQNN